MLTETTGQVDIDVPRDQAGTFKLQIVTKRQRRLTGVDEVVLSLYVKGFTTGEMSTHLADIYGASVSKETISRITRSRAVNSARHQDAIRMGQQQAQRIVPNHYCEVTSGTQH